MSKIYITYEPSEYALGTEDGHSYTIYPSTPPDTTQAMVA